jgi:uncharacterized protein YegJ (DUF2314 family)
MADVINYLGEISIGQWIVAGIVFLLFAPNLYRLFFSDAVVAFDPDDKDYLAATTKAKETISEFWQQLEQNWSEDSLFGVKIALPLEVGREHVWLALDANSINSREGLLMNRPQHLKMWEGERIKFNDEDITDWMIIREHGSLGGYSIRAMLRKVPEGQARAMADQHRISYEEVMAEK